MRITITIPTCIYPRGCKAGVESALAEVEHAKQYGHEVQVVVVMDGNQGYQRLDLVDPGRFAGIDKCAAGNPTDTVRIERDNGDVQDYEWLRPHEESGAVKVIRNATNLGGCPTFNICVKAGFGTDLVATLMDDTWLLPGAVSWMAALFTAHLSVAFAGYSNTRQFPEPCFEDVPIYDDLMNCGFYRGSWVREMFLGRDWLFNEQFHIVNGDGYLLKEVRYRGHDIGYLCHPRLVTDKGQHRSLGKWQFDNIMADRETAQRIGDPVPRVNERLEGGHVLVNMDADEPRILEVRHDPHPELTHWDSAFNPNGKLA